LVYSGVHYNSNSKDIGSLLIHVLDCIIIVDYRLRISATDTAQEDWLEYSSECLSFLINNREVCVGVYGNGSIGSSSNSVGRPSINENNLRDAGILLRDHLRDRMVSQVLRRVNRTWDSDACHHTNNNDD
jgi:hypothetical protein